ncbi:cellulose biosynthesis cyclic di-GMP-binding regulatory protein BcsB [Nocardioides sp.]|uniref:cellulose biosynthesis cyclic di-GMP-binding regulatory protein BcsB n=1 Tax=Nocardioides sp. TaxID=35761 RepID=UPI00286AC2D5|nr:cellulose biosynthesis cyclic di-GMP-binding regulatory protein BcsB [Nocardioides sp.]
MRATLIVAVVATCLSTSLGVMLPVPAASADEMGLPQALGTQGTAPNTISLPVPAGVVPTAIRARLSVEGARGGSVRVVVAGRTRVVVAARPSQPLSLPVSRADVGPNGTISVGTQYVEPRATGCRVGEDPVLTRLSGITLAFDGTERTPTSVAGFLPATASRVDVVVPDDASPAVLEAGLTAVVALSDRYPAPTPVLLTPESSRVPDTGAGQRIIRIDPGPGSEVISTIATWRDVPTLTIAGSGPGLVDAARALDSDALALGDAPSVTTLGLSQPDRDVDTRLSLAELGNETLRLSGWGRSSAYVGIPQDSFGGPVDSLELDLVGVHTAVRDAHAQVEVFLNDRLVGSTVLDEEADFSIHVEAPASMMRAENALEVTLTAAPDDGRCGTTATQAPVLLDIDPARSFVATTRGTGHLSGFDRFPQVFGGEVAVAVRPTSTQPLADAQDAAVLLAALQRVASHLLTIRLVSPDELITGTDSGLLVGATYDDSAALRAPLRLSGMRLVDLAEETFSFAADSPYAALEAVHEGGRDVLLLGEWYPEATLSRADLTDRAVQSVASTGWRDLHADLLIATQDREPFRLSTDSVIPQADRLDEQRSLIWWFGIGTGLVLLVLLLQLGLASHRNRAIRDLVRAQESGDGPGLDD